MVCLALAGCHSKKKIQPKQEQPVVVEEPGPAQPEPQPVPQEPAKEEVTPEPAPAVEPIVELVEEALEQKAEEPQSDAWEPQYQTAYGRGMVTIFYRQQRLSSPVVVTYIADSIVLASVQPLMGIEMYRLEALRDRARLFEKLNRRYVEMTYEEISQQTRRQISFDLVQQMVENVGLTYPIGQDTTLRYSGVEAKLSLQYRTVNQPVSAFPISTNGYNRTTINALLSK
jgi:type IV secretory pathway VirB10-like protein